MFALRNRRFRRWIAAGVAILWLFTVLACAMEGHQVTAVSAQDTQVAADIHSGPVHHKGGDSQDDDDCCQWQATSIPSFNVIKLPSAPLVPALISLIVLLVLALPAAVLHIGAVPDEDVFRWRSQFLVHIVQAQAPPR